MTATARRTVRVDARHAMAWGRQALLTVGALLGMLCLLTAAASAVLGVRPLVFESGSMSPTIATGALALSRDVAATDLRTGDIVSVPTATGSRVTHRIVAVQHDGDTAVLRLQGDANRAADAMPYRVTHADRVLFDVPGLGYVVGWLSGPVGLFALGLYAAFLLSVLFRGQPGQQQPAPERLTAEERVVRPSGAARRGSGGHLTVAGCALAAVVVTGGVAAAQTARAATATLAAWTDRVGVSGASLTAYTVPATALTCSKQANATVFSWTAVPGATGYTISFSGGAAKSAVTQPSTTYTDTSPSAGRTATVVVNRAFGPVTWASVPSSGSRETNSNGQCS